MRNVSLGYALGRLLGLALIVGILAGAVSDPLTLAFLILVFLQPLTLLRSISIATARVLA